MSSVLLKPLGLLLNTRQTWSSNPEEPKDRGTRRPVLKKQDNVRRSSTEHGSPKLLYQGVKQRTPSIVLDECTDLLPDVTCLTAVSSSSSSPTTSTQDLRFHGKSIKLQRSLDESMYHKRNSALLAPLPCVPPSSGPGHLTPPELLRSRTGSFRERSSNDYHNANKCMVCAEELRSALSRQCQSGELRTLVVKGETCPSTTAPGTPAINRRGRDKSKRLMRQPTKHIHKVAAAKSSDGYVRLNQYKLMQDLGQGSYGIVKLAYSEEDNNHYAMKILDKKKLMKKFAFFRKPPQRKGKEQVELPDPLQQVYREIAILKKLDHSNVVKLVEVLDDPSDDYLYMVFEYVERGCALDIPTTEPLSEPIAWTYFRDTVLGLEYLHYHKIVHRDIKPSNLLLTNDGHIKIADFGVSSEFQGLDALLKGTAGTPAFMAPEALTENSEQFYSGRAQDIWSLGITLYAFVIGHVPFYDNFVIALHKKIRTESLKFPDRPRLTQPLMELISHMLCKNPTKRLSLSQIKEHSWVTRDGAEPLRSSEENCTLVVITDEDVRNSVRVIPRLDTLILIKAMGQRRRFGNPFRPSSSGNLSKANSTDESTHEPLIRCESAKPAVR